MNAARRRVAAIDSLAHFLSSPMVSPPLTLAIVGSALGVLLKPNVIGWLGRISIVATHVELGSLSLIAQAHPIEWKRLLPISLLIFDGWASVSIFWSRYQWTTFGSVSYLLVFTTLGLCVAPSRDPIQIARVLGDMLRFGLIPPSTLEIFSGVLIVAFLHFLNIRGTLASLDPIKVVFRTRNELGMVTLIAISHSERNGGPNRTKAGPSLVPWHSAFSCCCCADRLSASDLAS